MQAQGGCILPQLDHLSGRGIDLVSATAGGPAKAEEPGFLLRILTRKG